MVATVLAGAVAPENVSPAYWLVYYGNRVLLNDDGGTLSAPLLADSAELGLDLIRSHFIGMWGEIASRHHHSTKHPYPARLPPNRTDN